MKTKKESVKSTYGIERKELNKSLTQVETFYKENYTTPGAVVKDLYNDFKDMNEASRIAMFKDNDIPESYYSKAISFLSDRKFLFKIFSVYLPKINGVYCTKYTILSIKNGEEKINRSEPKETFKDIKIIKKVGFKAKQLVRENENDLHVFGTKSADGMDVTNFVYIPKESGYKKSDVLKALNAYMCALCPNLQEIDEKSKDINKLHGIDTPVYTQETTKKETVLEASDALNFAVEQINADKTKQKKVGIYEFVCVRIKDNEKVMTFSHKEIKTLGVVNLSTNGLKQYIKIA